MLTLPDTLDNLLNKYLFIPITKLHELGHAKAICKVIKKNPTLNQAKPIILLGDYKNSPDPIYIDEEKCIIGFEQNKCNTKGITLHPDFPKMSDKELIKCLCAGYLYEFPICLMAEVLFNITCLKCRTNYSAMYYFFLFWSFITPILFIVQILKSSDLKFLLNLNDFRYAYEWSALYDSYAYKISNK